MKSNTGHLKPSSSLACKTPQFMDLWGDVHYGCMRVLNDPHDPNCRNLHPIYSKVYRLASNACQRVPALVRGSANERVPTRDNIAQQCLVLYYLLRELLKEHLEKTVVPQLEALKGKFFTDDLKANPTRDAIENLVNCEAQKYGLELPELYVELWNRYSVSITKLCVVFAYLQNTWHNLTIQQNNSSPFNVQLVASSLWNDHVLGPIKEILGLILVGIVKRDRQANNTIPVDNCPKVELDALKRVLTALLELNPHTSRPHIAYQETFESYLFNDDASFFSAETEKKYPLSRTNVDALWNGDTEAAKRDLPNSLPGYLKIVQNWMNSELHRALSYMHRNTAIAIRQRILDRMLLNTRQEVIDSSITWLRTAASSNMESMRRSRHIMMNSSAAGIEVTVPAIQCHDLSLLCELLKDSDSTNSATREFANKFSQFVYQEGINSAFHLIADSHRKNTESKVYTPCSDEDLEYYSKLTAIQKKELLKTPESKKKQVLLTKDPSMLMAALLDEYGKYSALVHVVFQKNPVMTKALDEGMTRFLNENDVVGFAPISDQDSKMPSSNVSTQRSAQMLVRYFHALLCDNISSGMETPAACIHNNSYLLSPKVTDESAPFGEAYEANTHLAISFFAHLRDRDAFQLSYQTLLMNRLMYTSITRARTLWDEERDNGHLPSFYDIAEMVLKKERDVIDRLMEKSSADYVHRWILMINEAEQFIIASLDSMARGSNHNTLIVGQQLWPITLQARFLANPPGTHVDCTTAAEEFPFPGELQAELVKGEQLYSSSNKKKLSRWAPALSFGDIQFRNKNGDLIEMTVSYTQMMLFNAFDKTCKKCLTFSDLCQGFFTCPSCVNDPKCDRNGNFTPSADETTDIAKALSPMVKEGIVRIISKSNQKLFNNGLLPLDKFAMEHFELCLDDYQPPANIKINNNIYKVDIYLKYILFPAAVDLQGAPVITQDMSLKTSYFPGTTEGLLQSSRAETQVLGKARKESLEAVVVSILKTESSCDGTMSYDELYPKVSNRFTQLSLDFTFSVHDIKVAVNSLISKSYVEVSSFDPNRLCFAR